MAKLFTVPMVLKKLFLAKSKGKINFPETWNKKKIIPKKPERKRVNKRKKISSFLNKLTIIKYKATKLKRERKLGAIGKGQPQKLPNLKREKITERPVTKSKIRTGKLIKLVLISTRLETKILINQQIKAKSIKKKSKACLLKSKTLLVQGKKKSGNKKIKR